MGGTSNAPVESGSPVNPNKYEFRDLKRDLESIHEEYSQTYPAELVYQKIFDITF